MKIVNIELLVRAIELLETYQVGSIPLEKAPCPAVYKHAFLQPLEAWGQTLKPLSLLGARYKTAVI